MIHIHPMTNRKYSTEIEDIRKTLLDLHKLLIDASRVDYEQKHGAIESPGKWMQLLIGDSFFSWLHPFSKLITTLDELLELEQPIRELDAMAVRMEVEHMFGDFPTTPQDFRTYYLETLQKNSDVVLTHSSVKQLLQNLPKPDAENVDALLQVKNSWKVNTVKIIPRQKRIN